MSTEATEHKRAQLGDFIERKLADQPSVRAVIAVGSIANGTARPGSDIDAFVFLDPFDLYLVPAESVWRARDDTFHSIFSGDESLDREGIQLDFHRVDLRQWRDPSFEWPEPVRAELAAGWIAFDRDGQAGRLVRDRTAYPEDRRRAVLDEALPTISDNLESDKLENTWDTLGPLIASDRLQAVYDELVRALFAYNRTWQTWRSRRMTALLHLPWLPEDFSVRVANAAVQPGRDKAAYDTRAGELYRLSERLVQRVREDGLYGDDPVDEAFVRAHAEPGRAWNMDEWNAERSARAGRA